MDLFIIHHEENGNSQSLSPLNRTHILASVISTPFTFSLGICTSNLNISPSRISEFHNGWLLKSYVSNCHYVSCYVFKGSQIGVHHSSNTLDQSCRPPLCQYTVLDLAALPNYINLMISISCQFMWDALIPSF